MPLYWRGPSGTRNGGLFSTASNWWTNSNKNVINSATVGSSTDCVIDEWSGGGIFTFSGTCRDLTISTYIGDCNSTVTAFTLNINGNCILDGASGNIRGPSGSGGFNLTGSSNVTFHGGGIAFNRVIFAKTGQTTFTGTLFCTWALTSEWVWSSGQLNINSPHQIQCYRVGASGTTARTLNMDTTIDVWGSVFAWANTAITWSQWPNMPTINWNPQVSTNPISYSSGPTSRARSINLDISDGTISPRSVTVSTSPSHHWVFGNGATINGTIAYWNTYNDNGGNRTQASLNIHMGAVGGERRTYSSDVLISSITCGAVGSGGTNYDDPGSRAEYGLELVRATTFNLNQNLNHSLVDVYDCRNNSTGLGTSVFNCTGGTSRTNFNLIGPIRGSTITISIPPSDGSICWINDVRISSNLTLTQGTINLDADVAVGSFVSSNSNTRRIEFDWAWIITGNQSGDTFGGSGILSMATITGLTSDALTADGGFILNGTGSSTWGNIAQANAMRVIMRRNSVLNNTTANACYFLKIEDGVSPGTNSQVTVMYDGVTYDNSPGSMLNLTVILGAPANPGGEYGYSFPFKVASVSSNVAGANWRFDGFQSNGMTLSGTGANYILANASDVTGAINCTGAGAYYEFGYVRCNTVVANGAINGSTQASYFINDLICSQVWGFTLTQGILTLGFYCNFQTNGFISSNSNTRRINFDYNYINITGTGGISMTTTTGMTTDMNDTGEGGFNITGTGSCTLGTLNYQNAPKIIHDGNFTFNSGNVWSYLLKNGRTIGFSTITLVRDLFYDEGAPSSLANLTIILAHNYDGSTYSTWDYRTTRIGTINSLVQGLWNLNYLFVTNSNFTGTGSVYNFNEAYSNGTIVCGGNAATTHNLNYVRASNLTLNGTGSAYLSSDVVVSLTLTLTSGNLTLNSDMYARNFSGSNSNSRSIILAGRTFFNNDQAGGYGSFTMATSTNMTTDGKNGNGWFQIEGAPSTVNFGTTWSENTAPNVKWYLNIGYDGQIFGNIEFGANSGNASLTRTYTVYGSMTGDLSANTLQNATFNLASSDARTINVSGSQRIGTLTTTANGSYTVNNVYFNNFTLAGNGATYTWTDNNASSLTLNLTGPNSTYNFTFGGFTTLNINASNGTINLSGVSIYGNNQGTTGVNFTQGTVNCTGNNSAGVVTSTGSISRTWNQLTSRFYLNGGTGTVLMFAGATNFVCTSGGSQGPDGGTFVVLTASTMVDPGTLGANSPCVVIAAGSASPVTLASNRDWRVLSNNNSNDSSTWGNIQSGVATFNIWRSLEVQSTSFGTFSSWSTNKSFTWKGTDNGALILQADFIDTLTLTGSNLIQFSTDYSTKHVNTLSLGGSTHLYLLTGNLKVNIFSTANETNTKTLSVNTNNLVVGSFFNTAAGTLTFNGTGYIQVTGSSVQNGSATYPYTLGGGPNFNLASGVTILTEFNANILVLDGTITFNATAYINGDISFTNNVETASVSSAIWYIGGSSRTTTLNVGNTTNKIPALYTNTNGVTSRIFSFTNNVYTVAIRIDNGMTWNTNNYAVRAQSQIRIQGTTNLGTSAITIDGTGAGTGWDSSAGTAVINTHTSSITFTGTGADKNFTFGQNQNFYQIINSGVFTVTPSRVGYLNVTASATNQGTIDEISNAVNPSGFKFTNTPKIVSFLISGVASNLAYIEGNATKPGSTGLVNRQYLSVKNSAVSGGAPPGWYAGDASTDEGGNSGWIFTNVPGLFIPRGEFFLFF